MDEHDPQTPTEGGDPTPPAIPPASGEMPPSDPPASEAPGAGDLPSMPATGTEWGTPTTPMDMPIGEPPKKNNMGLFIGIGALAVVVIAAVAFFALKKGGGGTFPETLGGVPRNHSAAAQQLETQFKGQNFNGMTAELAVYGTDTAPSHVAILFDNVPAAIKGQSLAPFLDQLASGFTGASPGNSVDTSQALSKNINGVDYLCLPAAVTGSTGALCVFNGSRLGAVVTFTSSDPNTALALAQQVSDSVS